MTETYEDLVKMWYHPGAKCPKCSCTVIEDVFHQSGEQLGMNGEAFTVEAECVQRTCDRCSHMWAVQPMDSWGYPELLKEVK